MLVHFSLWWILSPVVYNLCVHVHVHCTNTQVHCTNTHVLYMYGSLTIHVHVHLCFVKEKVHLWRLREQICEKTRNLLNFYAQTNHVGSVPGVLMNMRHIFICINTKKKCPGRYQNTPRKIGKKIWCRHGYRFVHNRKFIFQRPFSSNWK